MQTRITLFFFLTILITSTLSAQKWVDMIDSGKNFYTIQNEFYQYYPYKKYVKGNGWKQFKRWEHFMEERVYPTGKLPASNAAWAESQKMLALHPNKLAHLISPCFDLANLINPTLSFGYHMHGIDMGTLDLEISTDDGTTWSAPIWSKSGDQGSAWHSVTLPLSGYGNRVKLRFKGTTGADYTSDMSIDSVAIDGLVNPVLTVTPTMQNVTDAAGSTTITVNSNVSWTVASSDPWVTLSPTSGTNNGSVTATYTANTGTADRTATITFTDGALTATATITQTGTIPFTWTSTNQSGAFIGQAQVAGTPATAADWIAAFDPNGNCAGAAPMIMNGGIAYFNLPIYGDDPTTTGVDEGIGTGEYFTLQLFDNSAGVYLDYPTSNPPFQFTQWIDNNGAPIPAYDDANDIYNFLVVVPLSVTNTSVNVSCAGGFDGSIDITVAGGTMPYTFAWSNNATTEDLNGLSAGSYTCTITDGMNQVINTTTIVITEPMGLMLSEVVTNISCNNGSDGAIDLTVTGGTSPYTYAWSNNATTEDINNLPIGTYTCTITDNNNCVVTTTPIMITEPTIISETNTSTNVSCNGGSDGTIDLTPAGGTSPYTYLWSNNATTEDLGNLSAGSYTCTITDNNNCTFTSSTIIITEPISISETHTVTNVSCNGGSNGAIDLTPANGATPYTFAWSNNATTEDLGNLPAGSYTCTITDANNCTFTTSAIIVTEPNALSTSVTPTNISCNGLTDGAISQTPTGGTTPYTYLWSNNVTTKDISGLAAGNYTCTITDANNCTFVTSAIPISEPSTISETNIPTHVTCSGGSNGAIDLTPAGGTSPYTFSWSNNATTEDISGLTAGNYTCTITDANNCTFVSSTITIIEPTSGITSTETVTNVSCNGLADGAIDLSVTGGTPSYTYAWNNNATTEDLSGLVAGSYTCTITDANNCTYTTTTITITEPLVLEVTDTTITADPTGNGMGAIDITVAGGTQPYTYAWSNATTTQDISNLVKGNYSCTITDANGCTITLVDLFVGIVSTEQISELTALNVFPNPTSKKVTVELSLSETLPVTISIYNTLGIKIEERNLGESTYFRNKFNLGNYPKGIYYINLEIEDKVITRKVILID